MAESPHEPPSPQPDSRPIGGVALALVAVCIALGGGIALVLSEGHLPTVLLGAVGGACIGGVLAVGSTMFGVQPTATPGQPVRHVEGGGHPHPLTTLVDWLLRLLLLVVLVWALVWLYRFEADRARALDTLKQLQSQQPPNPDGPRRPFLP